MACGELRGLPRHGQQQWCSRRVVLGVRAGNPGGVRRPGRRPGRRTSCSYRRTCRQELGRPGGAARGRLPRGTSRSATSPRTECWSSAVDRSGRRACWPPGAWASKRWPCPTSARRAGTCVPASAPRSIDPSADDLPEAVRDRTRRSGRPWSSTRSGSARRLPTRSPLRAWGAGSSWSGWARRSWNSPRTR